jgi:hypothetical protein
MFSAITEQRLQQHRLQQQQQQQQHPLPVTNASSSCAMKSCSPQQVECPMPQHCHHNNMFSAMPEQRLQQHCLQQQQQRHPLPVPNASSSCAMKSCSPQPITSTFK